MMVAASRVAIARRRFASRAWTSASDPLEQEPVGLVGQVPVEGAGEAVGEDVGRAAQAFPHPGTQLGGCDPAEADHGEPVGDNDALGEVAGGERCDRVGLAGARAGLQHGGAAEAGGRRGRSASCRHLRGEQRLPDAGGEGAQRACVPRGSASGTATPAAGGRARRGS